MSLDIEKIKEVAFLARIRVAEEHLPAMADELNGIIGFVERLGEIDTDGVEPMASVMEGMELPRREDEVTDGDCRDKVLANAPEAERGCFAVPKVVE